MKKIFLPLLALCGMITGLALTSCGGGGGGRSLSGTVITVGGGVAYDIVFYDKLMGSRTAYTAELIDADGTKSSPVTINIINVPEEIKAREPESLIGMKGSVSSNTIDYDDAELFFHILSAPQDPEDGGEDVDVASLYAPASFEIKQGEDTAVLAWKVKAVRADQQDEAEEENENNNPLNPNDTTMFVDVDLPEQPVIGVY